MQSLQQQSGRIDMLAAGLLIIPGRTLEMQFSLPYLNTTIVSSRKACFRAGLLRCIINVLKGKLFAQGENSLDSTI
jgi:hypothetical protein